MRHLAWALLGLLAVSCRDTSQPPPPPPPPGQTPVRLELSPASVLVSVGQRHTLTLKAFDAAGAEVDPGTVTWSSSRPEVLAVDAAGVVSGVALGSAQVTATVGALSANALALTAQLVPGAVTVTDAQLGRRFEPVDTTTPYGLGFRYRVDLVGVAPPAPGTILVASEAAPLAGRVVEVSGQTVTLEVVAVSQVFAAIELHETFTNLAPEVPQRTDSHVTRTTNTDGSSTYSVKQQPLEFELGPFDCEVEAGVAPDFQFEQADFSVTGNPTYEVEFTNTRQRLILSDEPVVSVTLKPAFRADLEGTLECKLELFKRELPVPGPVGIFFGATVLAGVGFGVEAKVPLVDGVSVLLTSQVKGRVRAGVDCTDFACTPVKEVEVEKPTGTFTPQVDLTLPTTLPKLELQADAFAYLEVKAGVTILRRFSFDTPRELEMDVVGTKLGLRATASLATEARQVQEKFYSSGYELSLHGEVEAGEQIAAVLDLLGGALGVPFEVQDLDVTLAQSPKAQVKFNQRAFAAGDTVRAEVKFNPATLSFPLLGENLEKVRLYRVVRPADGGTDVGLVLMAEQLGQPSVADYTLTGVATVDSLARDFVVFASSSVWTSLSLEQEERCTVPPGYAYCVIEHGGDFFGSRLLPDGRVLGASAGTGNLSIWEEGQPIFELPSRMLPNDPNPVPPTDHNELNQTMYVEVHGNDVNTHIVVNGGLAKVIPNFLGRRFNQRGQILGERYIPDSVPGAEDGFFVPAWYDGMGVTDLPERNARWLLLSDTGLALGVNGSEAIAVPGGTLPVPDAGVADLTFVSPNGRFVVGVSPDGTYPVWSDRVLSVKPFPVTAATNSGRLFGYQGASTVIHELDGGIVNLRQVAFPEQGGVNCVPTSDEGPLLCSTSPLDGGVLTFSFLEPAQP